MIFKNFEDAPILLTVPETAELLRISVNHTYYVIRTDKTFPIIAMGRRILVPRDELQKWIKNSSIRK